jgi:hypothetical protein
MAQATKPRKAVDRIAGDVTNDAAFALNFEAPYTVSLTLKGVCSLLYHRYSGESVEAKAKAKKGSAAKKEDDVESYVYRAEDGALAIPGKWLYGAVTNKKTGAAKFRQDPRSPRKSALDLYTAGFIVTTHMASIGAVDWDFLHREGVVVNQSRIMRTRPALLAGWEATLEAMVLLPEYISPADVHDVVSQAGKLCGFGDYRPTYGRFQIIAFDAGNA